jgi:protein-tyrosine-phosphatase
MNILFVCTGNTCRSAMAEWMLKKKLSDRDITGIMVDSCGTDALPTFRVPPVVQRQMAERDVDITPHQAARCDEQCIQNADLIFVMEEYHRDWIIEKWPDAGDKVHFLKRYVGEPGFPGILDPMGHTDEVYIATARQLDRYLDKLIDKLITPA